MRVSLKRILAISCLAALVGLAAAVTPASASGRSGDHRPHQVRSLRGLDFTLQNNFDSDVNDPDPATLSPFFEPQSGTVGRGIEIDDGYIYNIDLKPRSITMRWNTDPAWDRFEPFVGAIVGLGQEEAAAQPFADQYHITFSEPVSHLRVKVAKRAELQPDVFFLDDHTLVVSIAGGTTIGDGVDTRIWLLPQRRR